MCHQGEKINAVAAPLTARLLCTTEVMTTESFRVVDDDLASANIRVHMPQFIDQILAGAMEKGLKLLGFICFRLKIAKTRLSSLLVPSGQNEISLSRIRYE